MKPLKLLLFILFSISISIIAMGQYSQMGTYDIELEKYATKDVRDITAVQGGQLYVLNARSQQISSYDLYTGMEQDRIKIKYAKGIETKHVYTSIEPVDSSFILLCYSQFFAFYDIEMKTVVHQYRAYPVQNSANLLVHRYFSYPEKSIWNNKLILPVKTNFDSIEIVFDSSYYEAPLFAIYDFDSDSAELIGGMIKAKSTFAKYPEVYGNKHYLPHYQSFYYAIDDINDRIFVQFEATPDVFIYDLKKLKLERRIKFPKSFDPEPISYTVGLSENEKVRFIKKHKKSTYHYRNAIFDIGNHLMARTLYDPDGKNTLEIIDLYTEENKFSGTISNFETVVSFEDYELVKISEGGKVTVEAYRFLKK